MNAGRLRHRVWIKELTATADGMGGVTKSWGTVTVCYASVEPLKGREWFESGLENSDVTARMRMRYKAGISPTMQVYFGSRTFEIKSVIDQEERHKELELMLRELVET